jgi:hypothetical protein
MEILIIAVVAAAGILATTFTTIHCLVRHAREKRDRQLFHAYVHRPHEVEAWLVDGALEHLHQTLLLENLRR